MTLGAVAVLVPCAMVLYQTIDTAFLAAAGFTPDGMEVTWGMRMVTILILIGVGGAAGYGILWAMS